MTTALVIVWPAADPKQRVHWATEGWEIKGVTVCGLPIKRIADGDAGEHCVRCEAGR